MSNVILIGFMGCGKSSIGRKLSYRIQRTILDTDKQIEREQKRTISEIFDTDGEEAFRRMETAYLKKLVGTCNNQIISTGGGLPMREENQRLLKKLGYVVWLRVKADTIYERLKTDTTRPLLQGENPRQKIASLLQQREPIYRKAADVIIDVDKKEFEQIVSEIQEALETYETISH